MKKSPSPLSTSAISSSSRGVGLVGGKENKKMKETDQFSYRGPVQWKVKTYSPYRGVKSTIN